MTAAQRRAAADYLCETYKVSQRRATRVLGRSRSTLRYRPADRAHEAPLRKAIKGLARKHPRWGYRMIHALLLRAGWQVNLKRVHRLWRELKLQRPVRRKKAKKLGPKRGTSAISCVNQPAQFKNDVWTYDFVADRTVSGSPLKWLMWRRMSFLCWSRYGEHRGCQQPRLRGRRGGILALNGATLTVSDSTFDRNQAIGGAGGVGGGGGLAFGGGIDAHAGTTLTLSDSLLHDKAAVGGGGAGGAGAGGGLSAEIFTTATISNAVATGNEAVGGAGGVGANGGGGFGGGAFIGATESPGVTPSLAVSDSIINTNRADGGAGGLGGSSGMGVGGGVYNLGDFSAIDAVIAGNHASSSDDDMFP